MHTCIYILIVSLKFDQEHVLVQEYKEVVLSSEA